MISVVNPSLRAALRFVSAAIAEQRPRRLSSSVIFSASRKRPRLSALHLRDTASLLRPEWKHLSPCLGAALTASPFAGNLMRMGHLVHTESPQYYAPSAALSQEVFSASQLASHLFFQLIRESPLHMTRSKSLPAAYLTPSIMGTLLGLSYAHNGDTLMSTKKSSNDFIRNILRDRHGIKSNYIDNTFWTGVSLSRWMDLIPSSNHILTMEDSKESLPLISSLWLVALWELSDSKLDFLEFLLALEKCLPKHYSPIFNEANPKTAAILHDPTARQEWADLTFDHPSQFDLSIHSGLVEDYLDDLLHNNDRNNNDEKWSEALEMTCAMISFNYMPLTSKPTCPTGYYGFDGGGIQADCAELTVREILNLLLWDDQKVCFDTKRLPSAASPLLYDLYDETKYPFQEAGDAWFQILSDLPGCNYFLESPNGRPYELVPTVSNVVRAIQILLMGHESKKKSFRPPVWENLRDLASYWQKLVGSTLHVHESTLTHKSSITGEWIHHEFATLRLNQSPSGIELRLRCDWNHRSGMSKVTHLRERQTLLRSPELLESLLQGGGRLSNAATNVLGLALTGCGSGSARICLDSTHDSERNVLIQLLGANYGCNRRQLLTEDLEASTKRQSEEDSEAMLKSAILQACQWSQEDKLLGATLLPWLLAESPSVYESESQSSVVRKVDRELQRTILDLPMELLGNSTIYEPAEYNWALHGKSLSAWARWKVGRSTLVEEAPAILSGLPYFLSR